jgi:amidase
MSVKLSRTGHDHFATASELAEGIARREIGCLEALEMYLARIETYDTSLNAVVVRDFERARKRARELDAAKIPVGPLHGVPMTVKESFDVSGLPTTFGLPEYADNVRLQSAVAVARLESAGAVVFGKTNVPRLLLDWQSFNAVYGVTNNPWDLSKTPGGSSGGSAAAVAAGFTGLELGSDIGGSIRVPAHMCGIFGHKPTWGLLPMIGHSLTGAITPTDISVIGPLARSAADLLLAVKLLAGPDPADSALHVELPPARSEVLAGMRVAVWAEDPASPTDPEITAQLLELAEFLARRGALVQFTRPPIDSTEAHELFLKLVAAAIGSRYTPEQLAAAKARVAADPDNPGPDAIMDRSFSLLHLEWLRLSERRHVVRRAWQSFFGDFDVLLCPPFGSPALAHDTATEQRNRHVVVNGETIAYNSLSFWPGVIGACYLPATVAPLGLTASRLPVGVQIVGPAYGDLQTLAFARILEHEWRAFVPPPEARYGGAELDL